MALTPKYVKSPPPPYLGGLPLPVFTVSFEPLGPESHVTLQNLRNGYVMEGGGGPVIYLYILTSKVLRISTKN